MTSGRPSSISSVCQEARRPAQVTRNVCSRMTAGQIPSETPFRSLPIHTRCSPGGEIGASHPPATCPYSNLDRRSPVHRLLQWFKRRPASSAGRRLCAVTHYLVTFILFDSVPFKRVLHLRPLRAAARGAGSGCAGRAGVSRQPPLRSAADLGGCTPLCQINKWEERRLLGELYYLVCLLTFSEPRYLQKFPSRKLLVQKIQRRK